MGLREYFELDKYGTTVRREVLAGVTTFAAMAYILIVNPVILHLPSIISHGKIQGFPLGPEIIATAVAAAVATILTGIYAKRPFAMAPYMGENALIALTVVLGMGVPWPKALGAVFWGGILFLIVSLLGIRAMLARAVPRFLAASWSVGIGLFLMFVGFAEAGISVPGVPGAPVKVGNMGSASVIAAIVGMGVALALLLKRVRGAILIGIGTTMAVAWALGIPPISPGAKPVMPNWGEVLGKLDIIGALHVAPLIPIIFVLFLCDMFDTMGTVLGLAMKAGFVDEKGRPVGMERVFHVDALATVLGAIFGTSTTGTFIESATGIEEGGRTGLTALVTGLLFLACIPLASYIAMLQPSFLQLASAPALMAVGVLMLSVVKQINFDDPLQVATLAITVGFMIFTFNIALGIAAGLVSYPLLALLLGRRREIHPLAWVLFAMGVATFVLYPYT
ncbi:MAG: NCS2 family permease [Crenarchaeota archaeon]|nr:NCS2 family permease [Thermoproteota archaeon]